MPHRDTPDALGLPPGPLAYSDGVALQGTLRQRRLARELPDTLLLLEHPPVYTRGRRAGGQDLPFPETSTAPKASTWPTPTAAASSPTTAPASSSAIRSWRSTTSARYLRTMEDAIIAALAAQGIAARSRASEGIDYTGVWVEDRKIASIGVHVSRGVTTHGFAVNVDNDLEPFSWVLACGLPDVRMTSLAEELGAADAPGRPLLSQGGRLPLLRGPRTPPAPGLAAPPRHRRYELHRARLKASPSKSSPNPAGDDPGVSATRSRANPGGMDVLGVLGPDVRPLRERKPPWFKVPPPGGERYRALSDLIRSENLHTVCQEAACPNVGECWERGTATFMILGDTCTRRCGFCNVKTGKPTWNDPLEPARVARTIARMGLRHAVITSVDRDDLPDKGASAFVGVIRQVRKQAPACLIEVLTPDFQGQEMPLAKVIAERPDVFNHNVEVVPRLYPLARRGSAFERSCRVLRLARELGGGEVVTKSGLMVGLGESHEEMVEAFAALRENGVQSAHGRSVPAPLRAPPAGRALLAPRRVRRPRASRLRARLRPRRRRPARALLLPRRGARPPVRAPASDHSRRTD